MKVLWLLLLVACAHHPRPFDEVFAGTTAPVLVANASHSDPTQFVSPSAADQTPTLERLWGPAFGLSRATASHAAGTHIWYGDHVIAMLSPSSPPSAQVLVLAPYVPLAEQLGTGPWFGFEHGRRLVGSSYADVRSYPGYNAKTVAIALPYYELGPLRLELRSHRNRDVVEAIRFEIDVPAELRERFAAAVKARFGETALNPDHLSHGFVWNDYVVTISENTSKTIWWVDISVPE